MKETKPFSMAYQRTFAKRIISDYVRNMRPRISVDGVFLFGSFARGKANDESDIDCIIISQDFRRMKPMRRLEFLSRQRKGSARSVAMDIFGYTPEEFAALRENDSPNVRQVLREGAFITIPGSNKRR